MGLPGYFCVYNICNCVDYLFVVLECFCLIAVGFDLLFVFVCVLDFMLLCLLISVFLCALLTVHLNLD